MIDLITASIVTKWDSDSMDDTFTGGIHFTNLAPARTSYPYVQIIDLGETVSGRSSTGRIEDFTFQATAWLKEGRSTDPQAALGALSRSLLSFFEFAELSIPSSYGKFMVITFRGALVMDDGGGIHRSVHTYMAQSSTKVIAP